MKLKKLVAVLICCAVLCAPCGTFAESAGLFAFLYIDSGNENEYIYVPVKLDYERLITVGTKLYAAEVAEQLKKSESGKRCIDLNLISRHITDGAKNHLWWDSGVSEVESLMSKFYAELKNCGAEIDYVIDDFEQGMSNWGFNHNAEKLPEIIADSRYEAEVRPLLEDAGFTFSDYGDTELQYLVDFGKSDAYLVWNKVMEKRVIAYYNRALYEPIKPYYPNVKFSNYGFSASTGENKIYDRAGHKIYVGGSSVNAGTHSSPVLYGRLDSITKDGRQPEDYSYVRFFNTAYNTVLFSLITAEDAVLSGNEKFMPWVPCKNWMETGMNNNYYDEFIFHLTLLNPDPLLLFNQSDGSLAEDEKYLSDLIAEANAVIGAKGRVLKNKVTSWDARYLLTGMEVSDGNIYRITPDLYTPGVSLENFLADEENMIFRIGNREVDFPDGSEIVTYNTERTDYGYWVKTPKGVYPEERRLSNYNEPEAPIETEDNMPTGYMVEVDYKNGDAFETDAPQITETVKATDFQGHWAESALKKAIDDGVIIGSDKGTEPDRNVTWAEFLTMMCRIIGVPTDENSGGVWYDAVANNAYSMGWIENTDNMEDDLRRENAALIMAKAMNLKNTESGIEFNDFGDFANEETINAVKACGLVGIINGYEDGSFKPNKTITRAEAVVMLYRAYY